MRQDNNIQLGPANGNPHCKEECGATERTGAWYEHYAGKGRRPPFTSDKRCDRLSGRARPAATLRAGDSNPVSQRWGVGLASQ